MHTILLDPKNANRIFIAISAAGAFRTEDGGATWKPVNRGLKSPYPSGPGRGSRPLRPSHRHAPFPAGRPVHAETLGCHAQRRRRRILAGDQRKPAVRLRLPDRCARARARDHLCCSHQERLRAFPAGRQAARLSQPDRRKRMGSLSPVGCRSETATSTCCATPWRSIRSSRAASILAPPAGRCTPPPTAATHGCHRPGPAGSPVGRSPTLP